MSQRRKFNSQFKFKVVVEALSERLPLHELAKKYELHPNQRTHTGKHCYGKTPMQTWKESLHLAQEKLLDTHYQNVVSLPLSDEEEAGNAGEQPARNNLTDWNGQGEFFFPLILEKSFQEIMSQKTHLQHNKK